MAPSLYPSICSIPRDRNRIVYRNRKVTSRLDKTKEWLSLVSLVARFLSVRMVRMVRPQATLLQHLEAKRAQHNSLIQFFAYNQY